MTRLIATDNDADKRLDVWIAECLHISRSQAAHWLESGAVTPKKRAAYKPQPGEEFRVEPPPLQALDLTPEQMPLDILYEDEDILCINKPAGLVVHPSPGHDTGTLVHALLAYCQDLSGINGALRPGIVHRLDKDTSGALVIAKNDFAHTALAEQFAGPSVGRGYFALAQGHLKTDFQRIETRIGRHPTDRKRMAVLAQGGRLAITEVRVRETFPAFSWLQCRLYTGRTHQIRVHLAHIGHPVLDDPVYGPARSRAKAEGQLLHCAWAEITHPRTQKRLSVQAPPPARFTEALRKAGYAGTFLWKPDAEF